MRRNTATPKPLPLVTKTSDEDGVLIDVKNIVVDPSSEKSALPLPLASVSSVMTKPRGVGIRGGKAQTIRTGIYYTGSFLGTANTTNTSVLAIQPSLSGDWSSYAFVYDECKVIGGRIGCYFTVITPGTLPTLNACCYDAFNGAGLSTTAQGIATAHCLKEPIYIDYLAVASVSTTPVTKSGGHYFDFQVPSGPGRTVAVNANVPGIWSSTSDAADTYGYMKYYLPAGGTAGVLRVDYVIMLDMLFRDRQ
jgi:hypothetical protein